jgi:hypothetical protein
MSGKLYWEINFIQDSKRLIRPIWKKRKVVAIVEVELFSGGVEAPKENFSITGQCF